MQLQFWIRRCRHVKKYFVEAERVFLLFGVFLERRRTEKKCVLLSVLELKKNEKEENDDADFTHDDATHQRKNAEKRKNENCATQHTRKK